MLTPIGKVLRRYRLENGLLLKEMADGIEVSSAFLSAIEMGRKVAPSDFVKRLCAWRALDPEEVAEIESAILQSAQEVRLKFPRGMKPEDKETASVLAREFPNLTPADFEDLREFLHRRRS